MPGPVPPASRAGSGPAAGSPAPGAGAAGAASASAAGAAGQKPGAAGLKTAWKTGADGRTTFRLIAPLVLWWAWVVFAVANVADLAIQSHDRFSLQVIAGILLVTGLLYGCALRPKVITDAGGVTVRNPFRDYLVPWGGLTGVYVGDSVEFQCHRRPPKPDKTIYSWALYSPRRARARAELRTGFGARKSRAQDQRRRRRYEPLNPPSSFGRLPDQAKEIANQHPSHTMAGELARRCEAARQAGAADGVLTGRLAWLPIAAAAGPLVALIVVIVAR
jgi:hypothetical protein